MTLLPAMLLAVAAAQAPEKEPVEAPDRNVYVAVTPFSTGLLVPYKNGAQLGWIVDESWTLEAEYLKGDLGLKVSGVEFAHFEEQLVLLTGRWFAGETFNVPFGIGQRHYEMGLGDEDLEKWVPERYRKGMGTSFDVFEVTRYVVDVGVGNRWVIGPGFTISADWFMLYVPVGPSKERAPILDYVEDEEGKKTLKKVLSVLRHTPTIAALKVGLGWSF